MLDDVSNPYSLSICRAVENVARQCGVGVLASSLGEDPERARELAATLFARRVDGLILVPKVRDQSYLRDEQETGTLVFVDRPPMLLPADSVTADNRAGAVAGFGICWPMGTGGLASPATWL
jgi:LacI family transcriptional regulator